MIPQTSYERSPLPRTEILDTARRALDDDALSPDEARELVRLLRVHVGLLAPQVEELARSLPVGEQGRSLALASVEEAQRKLRAGPTAGIGPERRAQQLARMCRALVFHEEELRRARTRTLST
ncbi:DUF6415 family natural product biosynthesis protein [Streptomyces sp. HNM0663]|uniref:DUF6415 family natural product biosynthesis protein n=1 Tax=Streptomyces chengmaiensis TaxID=3040919 RepID=A0ABT6HU15_9ACTN|nr:DUF6415 family natural product biosynthesis protein [Streptomyces chengmaiensis]MDH2391801.1 DUF6415 family natural product biosynthesis protein [Streptomyces chengmaiensis]